MKLFITIFMLIWILAIGYLSFKVYKSMMDIEEHIKRENEKTKRNRW